MLEPWYPFINLHNHIYTHSKVVHKLIVIRRTVHTLSKCKVRRKTVTMLAMMQKTKIRGSQKEKQLCPPPPPQKKISTRGPQFQNTKACIAAPSVTQIRNYSVLCALSCTYASQLPLLTRSGTLRNFQFTEYKELWRHCLLPIQLIYKRSCCSQCRPGQVPEHGPDMSCLLKAFSSAIYSWICNSNIL